MEEQSIPGSGATEKTTSITKLPQCECFIFLLNTLEQLWFIEDGSIQSSGLDGAVRLFAASLMFSCSAHLVNCIHAEHPYAHSINQMQPTALAIMETRVNAYMQKKLMVNFMTFASCVLSLQTFFPSGWTQTQKAMCRYTVRNRDQIWCQCCSRFWKEEETELPLDLRFSVGGSLRV